MKTYLTETISGIWAGKRIKANSIDEAKQKCPKGFLVIGELVMEIEAAEFDYIGDINYN